MLFTSQIILSGFSPWAQLPKAAFSTFILRDWEAVKVGRAAQAEKFACVRQQVRDQFTCWLRDHPGASAASHRISFLVQC